MSESVLISQVDATMQGNLLFEFVDELPLAPNTSYSELQPQIIHLVGDFTDDVAARISVKTYTVLTKTGPLSVCAQGQILEADNELFRLFNWEDGRKNCVGLFHRREVIALFEVAQPSDSHAA